MIQNSKPVKVRVFMINGFIWNGTMHVPYKYNRFSDWYESITGQSIRLSNASLAESSTTKIKMIASAPEKFIMITICNIIHTEPID